MRTSHGRLRLVLFSLYLLLYGGFVLLTAFGGDAMERTLVPGVNVAILYGFALIAVAVVFAVLYGTAGRRTTPKEGG